MRPTIRVLNLLVAVLLVWGAAVDVSAQSYPSKPIRLIVGYAPGGSTDIAARVIGQKLSTGLGQAVVIDNRPGASSNLGAELAAKAAPDGYTLYMCTIASSINQTLYKSLPFDLVKSFTPVSQVTSMLSFLVVHPSLPAKSVKELIALAKTSSRKLDYATTGAGSSNHMAAEMFKHMAGVDMVHVSYKGTGPELTDLLAGVVKVAFETTPAVLPHVKAGKLRALAVNSATRTPLLPDVPTMGEAALPGFEVTSWNGIVAPAGTPKEIVGRLSQEVAKAVKMPDVVEKLSGVGASPVSSAPEQFGAFIQGEIAKWAKVIKQAGITAE